MGYFGMAYYLENKGKIKALKLEGVGPSIDTAKSGKYSPLSRPLFIYVSSKSLAKPEVEEYVRYYLQNTSSDMIKEIGYVPMTESDMNKILAKFEDAVAEYK